MAQQQVQVEQVRIHLYPYMKNTCTHMGVYTLLSAARYTTDIFHIPLTKCVKFENIMMQYTHEIQKKVSQNPGGKEFACQVTIKTCKLIITLTANETAELIDRIRSMITTKVIRLQ